MRYHEAFADLAGVYLEDSWVLDLAPTDDGLALRLEVVLTPENALYAPPKPGEQHCYRTAWLSVLGLRPADVVLTGAVPAVDASGEQDFGNVDAFVFDQAKDCWEIEGGWGYARIHSPTVTLRFD